MFGSVSVRDSEYLKTIKNMGAQENGYLPFNKSIELAKRFQPGNPENPDKAFLKEILLAVQDELGIDPDSGSVKAYTAIGTPLDKFHGVDAFLSIEHEGRKLMVTIDATKRPEKQAGGGKADIIVGELPNPDEDEEGFLKAVEKIGERISKIMREKYDSQNDGY